MLSQTFCCFSGISESGEIRLWQQGVRNWDELILCGRLPFGGKKREAVVRQIPEAKAALKGNVISYFIERLPTRHRVRVLDDFIEQAAFLDIETTGLERNAQITSIALGRCQGAVFRVDLFVKGRQLEQFLSQLADVRLWVTFNGCAFDLPRLEHQFKIKLSQAHLDMRPVLSGYGLKGGQKEIEKRLGFTRDFNDIHSGAEAAALWKLYEKSGDDGVLRMIMEYNARDVVQLYRLAIWAYNRSTSSLIGTKKLRPAQTMNWRIFSNEIGPF